MNCYKTSCSNLFIGCLLFVSLLFSVAGLGMAQSPQTITFKTSLAVGDSVRLKVVSIDAAPVLVEGLSKSELSQTWEKYEIKNQTITLTGPVRYFAVFNNGVTELSVSNAVYLDRIDCEENRLKALDLNEAPNITMIFCHKNSIEKMDIQKCEKLTWINCSENKLTSLNLSGQKALSKLVCSENLLKSLDLTPLASLASLACGNNQLTSLSLSSNKNLTDFSCGNNKITSLTMNGCIKLKQIFCEKNQLSSIDLTSLTSLVDLRCYENQLEGLDFTPTPKIVKVYIECNKVGEEAMLRMMQSLPNSTLVEPDSAVIGVYDSSYPKEMNVCKKNAVQIAKEKAWKVVAFNGKKYEPYGGADDIGIDLPMVSDKPFVYPTVAQDRLFITLSESESNILDIYTMDGQKVFSMPISRQGNGVDVSSLAEGNYVARVGNRSTFFIIQR